MPSHVHLSHLSRCRQHGTQQKGGFMAGRTCTVVLMPGASTSMALGQYCRASKNLVVVAPGHVCRA